MITREDLQRVFGPDAFGAALFYMHSPALRFELSLDGTHLDQFEQAFDRGREILDFVFRDSPRLTVVLAYVVDPPFTTHRSVVRSVRDCGLRIGRPRAVWRETVEDEAVVEVWGPEERTHVAFECDREALHRLLWGAVAVDLTVRPRLECRVYLADPERGVLAHAYDDRGMDVIGPNAALLKELYDRFNACLLDYDRARMDGFFGGNGG